MPKRPIAGTQLDRRKARSRRSRSGRARSGREVSFSQAATRQAVDHAEVAGKTTPPSVTPQWPVPKALDIRTVRTSKSRSVAQFVSGRNRFRLGFWIPMLLLGCLTVGAAVGLSMEMSHKGNLQWTSLFNWTAR